MSIAYIGLGSNLGDRAGNTRGGRNEPGVTLRCSTRSALTPLPTQCAANSSVPDRRTTGWKVGDDESRIGPVQVAPASSLRWQWVTPLLT